MEYRDKINLSLPKSLILALEQDMRTFELFKADRRSFNWNCFLSRLIIGYHEMYLNENGAIYDGIIAALHDTPMDTAQKDSVAKAIMRDVLLPEVQNRRNETTLRGLKPRKDTEGIIRQIDILSRESGESVSKYIHRMLSSYVKKPLILREQIVFRGNYTRLLKCCEDRQPIAITTIWDGKKYFNVIPWGIASGAEEIHNYLLCQVEDDNTHAPQARSFALHRIKDITIRQGKGFIVPEVERRLEMMREKGPAYAINDDEEIRVKLSMEGIRQYHRIYFGRPEIENNDIENIDGGQLQHHRCSADQAFIYFKKLDPREVEILSPESLRRRMLCFFQSGVDIYSRSVYDN